MRNRTNWILSVLLLLAMGVVRAEGDKAMFRVVGYFSSWAIYDREFFVTDIAADKLTHINYAFFLISEDGQMCFG